MRLDRSDPLAGRHGHVPSSASPRWLALAVDAPLGTDGRAALTKMMMADVVTWDAAFGRAGDEAARTLPAVADTADRRVAC